MSQVQVVLAYCSLARPSPGGCGWCGGPLPKRRKAWCGDRCANEFQKNHWWTLARRAAKRRDKYCCVRCGALPPPRAAARALRRKGRLEVNHVKPCLGRHSALSCSHHLDNLETLCPPCHRVHTRAHAQPLPSAL
ncbi:MAG: HNH endonuclease [Elusimicrobia bacterium]|nr:HNH endonuclease [Elusimicrobiota bacterium]